MARGANSQSNNLVGQAKGVSDTSSGNANNLFNNLFPQFSAEASNPTGYGAADLSAINTAGGQSVGGSVAGAVGQGNLQAARTRNSGAFQAGADEAARSGMRQNSNNALNTQVQNANLKQQQKQQGLSGLAGLYGQNENELLGSMGIQNEAINTGINAGKSGWFQNLMNLIQTIKPGGSTGGGSSSFSFGG